MTTETTIKSHKGTVRIPKSDGNSVEVDATIYGPLAVHKKLDYSGHIAASGPYTWVVTHVETGKSVRDNFEKKHEAVRFLRMIVDLDWSGDVKAIVKRNRDAIFSAWERYNDEGVPDASC